jgi:DNA-binding HxlR family transcriptional regulator
MHGASGANQMKNERRTYSQYCPLARALDVLGERWTLLIIRELLSGPKRFKDLQDALIGIGTNLLSTRLKEIEKSGIVSRSKLPPPGVASVYELTERGRRLDETVLSLARWGITLMEEPRKETEYFKPHWLLHGMLSTFNPRLAQGVAETYEFRVEEEVFHVRVQDGKASGDMGKAYSPDLIWTSDSKSFMELVFRVTQIEQAMASNAVTAGSREVLERALAMFNPVPLTP